MKCENCGKELAGGEDVIEVVYEWEGKRYARVVLCRECHDRPNVRKAIQHSAVMEMKKDMEAK